MSNEGRGISKGKEAQSNNPIKIRRIGANSLVATMKKLISKCKEAYEFADLRYLTKKPQRKLNKLNEYKAVNLMTIYCDDDDSYPLGKRITVDSNKKYAQIVSCEKMVLFATTKKDNLLIENEEIANTIQELIKIIYDKKNIV